MFIWSENGKREIYSSKTLGEKRKKGEYRLGTVRRPPRGIKKQDYSRLDYFDTWLPLLSPSSDLMKEGKKADDQKSFNAFKRKFLKEMAQLRCGT